MRRCKVHIRGHIANRKGLAAAHNYKYKYHQKDHIQHITQVVERVINGVTEYFILEKDIIHYKG